MEYVVISPRLDHQYTGDLDSDEIPHIRGTGVPEQLHFETRTHTHTHTHTHTRSPQKTKISNLLRFE
jgi:hypothetical protein